ncbi:ELM1/GtrOC1 family putative glycosyltransferase [Microbulbifer agarilyticus]|uniref:ELM1/GtrOC1 family putative glycosyltransferase n=1 Tax=Microbulbifer agarilyticus TaxID=260552 RepID=UPI001E5AFD4B|nr:ELM1/GtrOC1 family putative glycosyltransferase [Microbulbifer agarilyticus]
MGVESVRYCNIDCSRFRWWRAGALQRALEDAGAMAFGRPDFLVGAGHRCHFPLVAARRKFGGRSVVIMRPSLPISWFDFAIIPEHDRPPPLPNVLIIRGALSGPLPVRPFQAASGLILLGGPSKHFSWDPVALDRDIKQLAMSSINWTLTDSRRTPEFAMSKLSQPSFSTVPWRECPDDWLEQKLASVGHVWVTRDSISMVFEALQSRARVGVLGLPSRTPKNKVNLAIQRLVDEGVVSDLPREAQIFSSAPRQPLNQYRAIAAALLSRCGMGLLQ